MRKRKFEDEILRLLRDSPGMTSTQMRERLQCDGTFDRCVVAHALTKMFRIGTVRRERILGPAYVAYRYFATEENFMNLKDRVLQAVKDNPGITSSELKAMSEQIGVKESSICTFLFDLYANEKVVRKMAGGSKNARKLRYWVSGEDVEEQAPVSVAARSAAAGSTRDGIGAAISILLALESVSSDTSYKKACRDGVTMLEDLVSKHL